MSGYALLILSLTSGLLILVALVTPGWFGFDVNSRDTEIKMSMSIFYSKVCVTSDLLDTVTCLTMSNAEAMNKHASASSMSNYDSLRFTEFMVEASVSLIGIGIGTVLTALFAVSNINRGRSNLPLQSSSSRGTAGLVFIIIGGICGGIVCIETIIAHARINEAMDMAESFQATVDMNKTFPYSIVIMSFGLFVELVAVCVHIACLRSKGRADAAGIILTPSVNAPTVIVQSSTTRSAVPYSQFA